ncbi:uncharacterized protein AB9X84_014945 [Acanthopagrus schlegelii]
MLRITGVTLLPVILVVSFYHSAATASHEKLKLPIHVCGCTVRPKGKLLCLPQQKQNSVNQTKDLGRCLCSKPDQHMFKTACESFRKFMEPKLSLSPSTPL